jgi:hypothetical protein
MHLGSQEQMLMNAYEVLKILQGNMEWASYRGLDSKKLDDLIADCKSQIAMVILPDKKKWNVVLRLKQDM